MGKSQNKVDLSIVCYSLENNTKRFVFFFYMNGLIVNKHIEYVTNEDYSTFSDKFNQIIHENSFFISSTTIYNVNNETKMSTIKFPLRKFNNYKSLLNKMLSDKYGTDFANKYEVQTTSFVGNNNEITYKKLLDSKESIVTIKLITKLLKIKQYQTVNLASAIESYFVSNNSTNKIIVFFEASYVIVGCFVDGHITDLMFLSENDHIKIENGYSVDVQMNNIEQIIVSLVWKYQRNNVEFEKISVFCNSQRKLDKFIRKQNLLSYELEISNTTEIFFTPAPKQKRKFSFGFTLVETVIAFSIFAIISALVATLLVFVINQDSKTRLRNKINSYLYNVSEIVRSNPSEETIRELTAFEGEIDEQLHTYFINNDCDFMFPNLSKEGMKYQVDWKYKTDQIDSDIQNYTIYNFIIIGIYSFDNNDSIISPFNVEVVI